MDVSPKISPEMKTRYLQRRRADLEVLMDALAEQNMETFSRIGHQIKGNAITFGYEDLEAVGVELENAGQGANAALARQSVLKLHAWIESEAARAKLQTNDQE